MKQFLENKLKYKFLSLDELIINLDRLSRFKSPEESYYRVFSSIIYKNLIFPRYSKKNIKSLSFSLLSDYVAVIWNNSVKSLFPNCSDNILANKALKMLSEVVFKNIDSDTKFLLNTKLLIYPILKKISYDDAPLNLKFILDFCNYYEKSDKIPFEDVIKFSSEHSLKYPIRKLLIVEGITEEVLLPVFARKLKYDFDRKGIYVLGAGGKSKSPSLYLKLKNKLKIPVVILFDNDASEIYRSLNRNLLSKDSAIIIKKGEFEDIIPINLLKRALNKEYDLKMPLVKSDFQLYNKMCENIEYIYRTRGLGEFKKSKLAKILAENIEYNTDFSIEIKEIIEQITCK